VFTTLDKVVFIKEIAKRHGANLIYIAENAFILEVIGNEKKFSAITKLLKIFGPLEITRSGQVVIPKEDSGDEVWFGRNPDKQEEEDENWVIIVIL
jgi:acetolactate synthase small subunit